jgi:hypothetical protein
LDSGDVSRFLTVFFEEGPASQGFSLGEEEEDSASEGVIGIL